jgi:hypothetical protein
MELARAPGLRARRLGREQRLRFQGLAASHSPHKSRTHVPSCRPQQRLDHAQGGFLLYRRLSACPRASLVPCLPKPGVRWSGLKCRGLIQVPVIAVNPLRSRAVPDNSCPARNGKRRPPRRCLAPIRPPLFLSHAMKGDGAFQPSQGTARPEGDNASRSRHRQRAKAAHTSNGHRPGTRAGTGQEMETRHRAGDAPQGRRRATGPETPIVPAAAPSPGGLPPRHPHPAAFRRAALTPAAFAAPP